MIEDPQTVEGDRYAHLFRIAASERANLSSRENIALLARLRSPTSCGTRNSSRR